MATLPTRTALVLQGGGALGAYQAGVYEALADAGYAPDWIAGISIGAINAALIAGNPPENRVARLRSFWDLVSSRVTLPSLFADGLMRTWFNEVSAGIVAATGIPGFFEARIPPSNLALPGTAEAISYYDTAPLHKTLLELVDFDRIRRGSIRLSLGATHVTTGNFVYFDTSHHNIGPQHIMASGALPPAFAPVVIDGEPYWDGGLVSNTPLQYVLDQHDGGDPLDVFQVDLFSARGRMPRTMSDVAQREKDIRFSSRTRLNTDFGKQLQQLRDAGHRLLAKLPKALRDDPDAQLLAASGGSCSISILQLINRGEAFETQSKDYEFSRTTINEHWAAGRADVEQSLRHKSWANRRAHKAGITSFDLSGKGA